MECECPRCGWEGQWTDADKDVEFILVDVHGSYVRHEEVSYYCPICNMEVDNPNDICGKYPYKGV